jgi:hypothetical protein
MNTSTSLGEFLSKVRHTRQLTLMEIALACDLSESGVHKAMAGKPVRWETVHLILQVGLHIPPGSKDYETCRKLWTLQKSAHADTSPKTLNKKKVTTYELAAINRFRTLIRGMDERHIRRVLTAATRAAEQQAKA